MNLCLATLELSEFCDYVFEFTVLWDLFVNLGEICNLWWWIYANIPFFVCVRVWLSLIFLCLVPMEVSAFEVCVIEISIFMFALNADEKILLFVCLSLMILYDVTLKLLLVWDVLMNLGEICNLCSWDKCLCKLCLSNWCFCDLGVGYKWVLCIWLW